MTAGAASAWSRLSKSRPSSRSLKPIARNTPCSSGIRTRQQHHEFFAAKTGDQVKAAQIIAQPVGNFSGLKVEGLVGYDRADVEGEDSDGVTYGAGVGYDLQTGGMVISTTRGGFRCST